MLSDPCYTYLSYLGKKKKFNYDTIFPFMGRFVSTDHRNYFLLAGKPWRRILYIISFFMAYHTRALLVAPGVAKAQGHMVSRCNDTCHVSPP